MKARRRRGRWFVGLVGAVAVARLGELVWPRARGRRWARRGGGLVREPLYAAMVALHTAALVASPLEAAWWRRRRRPRPWVRPLQLVGAVGLAAATGLRIWTL